MPSKVKNHLAQLAKVERYIAKFQKLSSIHERALTERNDQLDYSWKDGYEKGMRDANATKQMATEAISVSSDWLNQSQQELATFIGVDTASESDKIQQLRLQLSTRESELDQKVLEIAEAKQKLLDQAKRHQQRVDELKAEIARKPEVFEASLGFATYTGPIVENWRDSWKWISNWCFGLIVFFATTPIPPEVLAVLPENVRYYFIAFTAFCGFVGRYINQSKPVALPPINAGDADV